MNTTNYNYEKTFFIIIILDPRKNNFSATDVAQTLSQTLSLPRPDSSGRALEHARQASR